MVSNFYNCRKAVLAVLLSSDEPLSYVEIVEAVKRSDVMPEMAEAKRSGSEKIAISRALNALVRDGTVYSIQLELVSNGVAVESVKRYGLSPLFRLAMV
jgi:hypothetical protein